MNLVLEMTNMESKMMRWDLVTSSDRLYIMTFLLILEQWMSGSQFISLNLVYFHASEKVFGVLEVNSIVNSFASDHYVIQI